MNRETLKSMDDRHLVSVLYAEQSALTSTDAEMAALLGFLAVEGVGSVEELKEIF